LGEKEFVLKRGNEECIVIAVSIRRRKKLYRKGCKEKAMPTDLRLKTKPDDAAAKN